MLTIMTMRFTSKKSFLLTLSAIGLIVLASAPSYYFYSKYQNLKNPSVAAKQEIQAVVKLVGKLMELPDEEPTVATVSDKEKLKDQTFFAKAANGDKVLIFTQERKAILYRPGTNKIIEVAPINIGEPQQGTESSQISTKIKLALYNGTGTTGLTTKVQSSISSKRADFEVIIRENAGKNDYAKTLVVDLSGKYNNQATELAKLLNADIGSLPETERKPEADILVIVGADQQ